MHECDDSLNSLVCADALSTFVHKKFSRLGIIPIGNWHDEKLSSEKMMCESQDETRVEELINNSFKAHCRTVLFR